VQQDSIVVQHADYHGHRPKFGTRQGSCLDSGADDYVVKPFAMGELLARIRAALKGGDASPKVLAGKTSLSENLKGGGTPKEI